MAGISDYERAFIRAAESNEGVALILADWLDDNGRTNEADDIRCLFENGGESGFSDGHGHGHGYGYGDGHGDGDGYGYGDGEYWLACLRYFLTKLPDAARQRAASLTKKGIKLAYWRSTADGRPANGGSADPVQAGTVHEEKGPLNLCHRGTLHATLIPPKWKGERWWIVALHGEVIGDDEKMGCLKREVIGECL